MLVQLTQYLDDRAASHATDGNPYSWHVLEFGEKVFERILGDNPVTMKAQLKTETRVGRAEHSDEQLSLIHI
eukprot:2310120-Alexandrium_andersonii.AAC.1